jgi:hypothetical protein
VAKRDVYVYFAVKQMSQKDLPRILVGKFVRKFQNSRCDPKQIQEIQLHKEMMTQQ